MKMKRKQIIKGITLFLLLLFTAGAAMPRAYAAAAPETGDRVTVNTEWSEETQRVLSLLEGPLGNYTIFSYQTGADYSGLKLCCDSYVNGEKEEEEVLLDFAFAQTPYEEPRRGDLFISPSHRYTTGNETYYQDAEALEGDGSVIEVLTRREMTRWDIGGFPKVDASFVAPVYQACFVDGAAAVEKGVPVDLLLLVETADADPQRYFGKTAQELLDAPGLLGNARYHVFSCIFS